MSKIKKIFSILKKTQFRTYNPDLKIGRNFSCGIGCSISKKNKIKIGDNFYMGNYCNLSSNLLVGDNVLFGSFVALVGGDHKIDNIECLIRQSGRDELKTTIIEDNVWIGHGTILMHGVHIKTGAVIAAGSVLTKNVGANEIWAGNPAKLIRKRKIRINNNF